MKVLKFCLAICLTSFLLSSYGQYSIDFSEVQQWSFKFKNTFSKEQAIQASVLIGSCNNVILARTDINGYTLIYSTGNIDIKEIDTKISNLGEVKHSKPKLDVADKMFFLKAYALLLLPESGTYTGDQFEPILFSDKVKEEVSFGLAKSIWIEKFPEKYSLIIPAASTETKEEKAEREAKENKVDFKSKHK